MKNIPKFSLYGQDNHKIEERIQPTLVLRGWSELSDLEKQTALQELTNNQWLNSYSQEILQTIEYLNSTFLRQCPGKHLHRIKPKQDNGPSMYLYGNEHERMEGALADFQHIFTQEESDAMVFRMLSKFAESYIDGFNYRQAKESKNKKERAEYLKSAFGKFDCLANCLNHIFEQFSVNQIVTRNGFTPRQDKKIMERIYTPTLQILSDPKWESVSKDLSKMFEDYQNRNYPETITKAHMVVQRFLQILVGEEGKSGRGELSKLFKKAKSEGLISQNRFTEPIIAVIQGFIPSERATNSTAKPSLKIATPSDALLMMNVVMVLLQHCLQKTD